jgi:hypothetical protein
MLHVWNVIFLQRDMDIFGPKGLPDFVISGVTGQRIHPPSTGLNEEDWNWHAVMFLTAVVQNAMRICFLPSLLKPVKMHTFIIHSRKRVLNFIA